MTFVAGVDTHKDTHAVTFLNGVGQVVKSLSIEANRAGYKKALKAAVELGDVVWGLESTGCYGSAFARLLLDVGAKVYEVPGSFTKRNRKASSRSGKSDPLDAQAIAETVLREGKRLPAYGICSEREAIRLRFDQRDRLVRRRSETINRIRSGALRLDLRALPPNLSSDVGLRCVECLTEKLPRANLAIEALVDDIQYGIEECRRINRRIKNIEGTLRPLMSRLAPELMAMRGVSIVVAAGLIGHAGNMRNCRNADAFAMRAGTAPVTYSSGRNTSVRVNIGGDRQLNRLLHTMALVQIRSAGHAGQMYYERKRLEGKTHRAALRSLNRQLSVISYYRLLAATARLNHSEEAKTAA